MQVAEAAVSAVGKLASRFTAQQASCISDLVSLINATTDMSVLTTVMHVLHKLDLRKSSHVLQVLKLNYATVIELSTSV